MIKVVATGSRGNFYYIQAYDEILLLECGIPIKDIKIALNFDFSKVVGCLLTHSHKDHSKAILEVLKLTDVYSSQGTKEDLGSTRIKTVESKKNFNVGSFKIMPFDVQHDVSEPLGYLISHRAIGKVLFVTDSFYLKYKFKDVDHILIECNYSEDILETLEPYRARLLKSHMSLETLKSTLETWDLSNTKDITLIHMSETNGNFERFREEIETLTNIKTNIAISGLEIKNE